MTAVLLMVLFVATTGTGAGVFYAGYRVGTGVAVQRRITKLLARQLAPRRLHSAEDAAEQTVVLRDDDLIAPDDSWPRQRLAATASGEVGPVGGES